MTLGAVHVAHLLDLDGLFLPGHMVGVAGDADLCRRPEAVQPHAVTGLTGDVLTLGVSLVPGGVFHLDPLRVAAIMALLTGLVRDRRVIRVAVRLLHQIIHDQLRAADRAYHVAAVAPDLAVLAG